MPITALTGVHPGQVARAITGLTQRDTITDAPIHTYGQFIITDQSNKHLFEV